MTLAIAMTLNFTNAWTDGLNLKDIAIAIDRWKYIELLYIAMLKTNHRL